MPVTCMGTEVSNGEPTCGWGSFSSQCSDTSWVSNSVLTISILRGHEIPQVRAQFHKTVSPHPKLQMPVISLCF